MTRDKLRRGAYQILSIALAFWISGVSLCCAEEGERVVPIDKVVVGNRLNGAVTVFLIPDLGTYKLGAGAAEEFACAIVKGFALSANGTKFKADCGKRYAITQHAEGVTIVEVVLTTDRP
jgi:hypothetical protein